MKYERGGKQEQERVGRGQRCGLVSSVRNPVKLIGGIITEKALERRTRRDGTKDLCFSRGGK